MNLITERDGQYVGLLSRRLHSNEAEVIHHENRLLNLARACLGTLPTQGEVNQGAAGNHPETPKPKIYSSPTPGEYDASKHSARLDELETIEVIARFDQRCPVAESWVADHLRNCLKLSAYDQFDIVAAQFWKRHSERERSARETMSRFNLNVSSKRLNTCNCLGVE